MAISVKRLDVIQTTAERFSEDALNSEQLSVVDFYADWCAPCRVVSPIMEQLSQEFDGRVHFLKVNVDYQGELAARYGVRSIPTVVLFKDGQEVNRLVGAASRDYYRQQITRFLVDGRQ